MPCCARALRERTCRWRRRRCHWWVCVQGRLLPAQPGTNTERALSKRSGGDFPLRVTVSHSLCAVGTADEVHVCLHTQIWSCSWLNLLSCLCCPSRCLQHLMLPEQLGTGSRLGFSFSNVWWPWRVTGCPRERLCSHHQRVLPPSLFTPQQWLYEASRSSS